MISKSQIKLITSLQQKKYRVKTGLFIAEGPKLIRELLQAGLELQNLYATRDADLSQEGWQKFSDAAEGAILISMLDMQKISALKNANSVLAVFQIPKGKDSPGSGLVVVLDAVRDPGNLGTIIRLCDWFGVKHLICSTDTVDCFNPKVVQATMGSLGRVSVVYTELAAWLQNCEIPVYAAVMDGEIVYDTSLPERAVLVMGNEASGISAELASQITNRLAIPNFSEKSAAESLNVATATGILLSEFRRKNTSQKSQG